VTGSVRSALSRILSATAFLLPPQLAPWARAMTRELDEIPDNGPALLFALGCLRAIFVLGLAARLRPLLPATPTRSHPTMNAISARPRLLGLICAIGAVAMGMAYMTAAGAPSRFVLMNFAALVLGASVWLGLGRVAGSRLAGAGLVTLTLAVALLLTALLGVPVDGAARWVSVGPLGLQVSLIVLPLMLVLYARRPDGVGTAAMVVAALALALQPDRAMAGVLAAGLLALLLAKRSRLPVIAASASVLAFGWTLLRPDLLPASPYVDRILYTAFEVHLLAGLAVLIGAAALVMPAALGAWKLGSERPALLAFGGCWAGVIVAAALGNYPTPLVGYGGSAVLGYLLSVALLPGGARESGVAHTPLSPADDGRDPEHPISELRVARLA
jgi:hypothetical protein